MAAQARRKLPLASSGGEPGALGDSADHVGTTIQGATSHDLVFAVIGHAGAGATHVATALMEGLTTMEQDARAIKMSALIRETAQRLDPGRWAAVTSEDRLVRTRTLQDAGRWLREKKGPAFTAGLAVRRMHQERSRNNVEKRPIAFVIDCLKNAQGGGRPAPSIRPLLLPYQRGVQPVDPERSSSIEIQGSDGGCA